MLLRNPLAAILLLSLSAMLRAEAPTTQSVDESATTEARRAADNYLNYLDPIVSLTPDQKNAYIEVYVARYKLKAHHDARYAHRQQAFAQYELAAMTGKSPDPQLAAEYHAACDPLVAACDELTEREKRILTFQQKLKLKDHRLTDQIKQLASHVELSSDQFRHIKGALADGNEDENTLPNYFAIRAATFDAMTVAQKKDYFHSVAANLVKHWNETLHLTEAQQKSAEALCTQTAADPEIWRQAIATHDQVLQILLARLKTPFLSLLTPDQKAQAPKIPLYPLQD